MDHQSDEFDLAPTQSSIESSRSEYRKQDGRFVTPPVATNDVPLTNDTFTSSVAVMLVCREHGKVTLAIVPEKGYWFPMCALKADQSYLQCAHGLVQKILQSGCGPKHTVDYKQPQLIDHLRLQVPTTFQFVERLLFYCELPVPHGQMAVDACCCQENSPLFVWISFEEAIRLDGLWGPEPAAYLANVAHTSIQPLTLREETIQNTLLILAKSGIEQEILGRCDIDERNLVKLYGEFVQHCFPSASMNEHSFRVYLIKSGIILSPYEEVNQQYFRSFQKQPHQFINVHDLVLGFVVLDMRTPHGGDAGALRVGYIYRFYKRSNDPNGLSYDDVRWFTRDLILKRKSRQGAHTSNLFEPIDEARLASEVANVYAATGVQLSMPIPEKAFLSAVGSLRIRGTSSLFRNESSPVETLKKCPVYNNIYHSQMHKLTCWRCRKNQFSLAVHFVTMTADGGIFDPRKLSTMTSDVLRMNKAARRQSEQAFYSKFIANEMIVAIRDFDSIRDKSSWGESISLHRNTSFWVEKIMRLCEQVKSLFVAESRIVQVPSPVYVLGDIHGNLNDLMTFANALWPMGPACSSLNYLFLGDYVDRGPCSIECIAYLFSCKLLAPDRFTLLRGNHEVRIVQKAFTFQKECLSKFGINDGHMVWEAFNQVFDTLPFAATIDEKIYCAHGGIPASVTRLQDLQNSIPCPMPDPDSTAAWEVLWNDPVNKFEFADQLRDLKAQNALPQDLPANFLPNTKRGTGYTFSEDALNTFLASNGLTHVLRAHEMKPMGFDLHFGGQLITVFSCSRYCELNNLCAVVMVAKSKIRIIQVKTIDSSE